MLRTQPVQGLAVNSILLGLWAWLFRPVYPYLATIFTRQEFRTNQIVLLAVVTLIVLQVRRSGWQVRLYQSPQLYPPALLLALAGPAAFLVVERWLDINTLSAVIFGLSTYGLFGLWIAPARWRQGLPAALLLVGVLPFGEHMETFLGYPLRVATARLVSASFAVLGIPNLGVDTILIFETGLSQVDNPCSGVKSLWTGGLFLLAATWIEARPLNRRWLLAAVVLALTLLAANLARVALLALAGPVAGWYLLAEMLHIPLGVAGFLAACGLALALLGRQQAAPHLRPDRQFGRPRWLGPVLAGVFCGLAVLYAPRPQPAAAAAYPWQLPAVLGAQDWPLSTEEWNWLSSDGALPISASRWRFHSRLPGQEFSGSLLFIASDTWRAHHRPERCFSVYGLEIQESRLHLAAPDFPLRWLTLGKPGDPLPLYTAAYWLQSPERVTDDYASRIWADLAPHPQPWILVTVLFDEPVDAEAAQALLPALRQAAQAGLMALDP